jgi:hypothetical protein
MKTGKYRSMLFGIAWRPLTGIGRSREVAREPESRRDCALLFSSAGTSASAPSEAFEASFHSLSLSGDKAGGTLENAQAMAAHESRRTTKLYDRTGDEITLDEVERIAI